MVFRTALYAAFLISGVSGLIYEVLWARYLGLLVGHSAYAQVIVLTIFLGGMGAGALWVGRRSGTLRDPLRWYARVEIAIAILAVVFDPAFRWVSDFAYGTLLPAVGGGNGGPAITWVIAASIILPQSLLLGTTFPLMTAGLLRREPALPGRTLAAFYFVNSLGAAVGVLLGGFALLSWVGLPGTLLVAAALNVVAGVGALVLSGSRPPLVPPEPPRPDAARELDITLLVVAGGTAVASFCYEVAWTRMLALLLGSATHAFELMLSAFILGLALGAWWIRTRADRASAVRQLGIIQTVMGLAALAALPLYTSTFPAMAWLLRALARTEGGYAVFSLTRYALSLALMLPATFCAGATLPLITRALLARGAGESAIGRVYGVNTLGSIFGVVLAGMVFLPVIGLKHTLVAGAAVDIALGVWLLRTRAAGALQPAWLLVAIVGGAALAAALVTPNFDRTLLSSGVYRDGILPPANGVTTVFYADGRTATVSATHHQVDGLTVISTNGKPDASLPDAWQAPCTDTTTQQPLINDMATQTLAPLITLAHRPTARRAAVIGFGSGMSTHLLLGDDRLEEVTTVEIEPAIARGARVFYPANRRAFDDPRSRLVFEDARAYFATRGERYDLIFSEPSNPWVSGVSSLFTVEFYRRLSRHLADDGVFGQWLHLYELNDELVLSVLTALRDAFPSFVVYQTWSGDILIVASMRPTTPAPDWSVFAAPGLASDLCHALPLSPAALAQSHLVDGTTLEPLLRDWGSNSDFYPVLDLSAERARFLRGSAGGFARLRADAFDVAAALHGVRQDPAGDTVVAVPGVPAMRAASLAAVIRTPGARPAALLNDVRGRARYTVERWRAALQDATPPADWGAWLEDFAVTERLVQGARAGVADEAFYGNADRAAARWAAPQHVRDVIALRRAAAAWDFAAARNVSDRLLPAIQRNEPVMRLDDFFDIATIARLRTGDAAGAAALVRQFASRLGRGPDDLRTLLVYAYARDSTEASTPVASTR